MDNEHFDAMHTLAIRRLAASVILRAQQDAQEQNNHHSRAVNWLASTAAEPYFDLLGLPQSTWLLRSGWLEWAEQVQHPTQCILTTQEHLRELQSRIAGSNISAN